MRISKDRILRMSRAKRKVGDQQPSDKLERVTRFELATPCLGSKAHATQFVKTQNTFEDHLTQDNPYQAASLDSLVQGYLLTCRSEGKSARTLQIYSVVLKNFLWFARQNGLPSQAQSLKAIHLRQFLWYVASESNRWDSASPAARKPASPSTVSCYYRVLHSFFNWLQREQLLDNNPFTYVKPPKKQTRLIKALSREEIERLFEACCGKDSLDIRNRSILSVFLDTGLRLSELSCLKVSDVATNTGSIVIRNGKGGKQRVVRIGAKAQKALWRYLLLPRRGDADTLFLDRSGRPLDARGIKTMIKRLGNKAGVKAHPHQLRHTFAISFLRAGGDVFSLQYLLGHSTLAMTQRYLQSLNADDAVKAHQRFSPLDNLVSRQSG